MENNQTAKYTVPMLYKAMQLLEGLAEKNKGLCISELVERLSLPKSSVYRILNSFEEQGYIFRDEDTGKYYITRKLFNLGIVAISDVNVAERAIEPMKRLRDNTKEAVFLGILVDSSILLLEQFMGSYDFSFVLKAGTNICIHASAPGKVICAHLKEDVLNELLAHTEFTRFNDNTIKDAETFKKCLEEVREKGYALDNEEQIYGVKCLAAPIFDNAGNIHAAVWISGPVGRFPNDKYDEIKQEVTHAAKLISSKLGYVGRKSNLSENPI